MRGYTGSLAILCVDITAAVALSWLPVGGLGSSLTTTLTNSRGSIEAQLDAVAKTGELTDALSTLPDTQRQALQLRVIDELNYSEAAALMGTSEQNARIRVSRALKTLSQRLQGVSR